MKASFLCGVHYEGAEPYLQAPPVPPAMFDAEVGRRSFDDYLGYAQLADELGFDWVSVSEHHYSPLILTPSTAPLAGALTQVVRRARIALLGPLASINNPVRIAEEIAILDQLSHGRLNVLPLRGTPPEFNVYSPVEAARTQGLTQEASLLIQKALSADEPFAWDGEYFHFPKIAVWPRTAQRPFPPMYFSGNSLNSAVFAGAHHFGLCMSFHRPEAVAQTVARYREEAARAGWQPSQDQIVYRGFVIVADTLAEAERIEATFLPPGLRHLVNGPVPGAAGAPNGEHAPDTKGPFGFGLGRLLFVGTPDMLVERIRAFHEYTGVGVLDLLFSGGPTAPADVRRGIELFGREVLPRIRDLGQPSPSTARAAAAGRP